MGVKWGGSGGDAGKRREIILTCNRIKFHTLHSYTNDLYMKQGNAVNSFDLNGTNFPLAYGKDVSSICNEFDSQQCRPACLDTSLVKGKIVLCESGEGIKEAYEAGALGSIVANGPAYDTSFLHPLPTSVLNEQDMDLVKTYYKSTRTPQASISKSEVIRDLNAPVVATFSSRGPNTIIPEILKPDLTAPGIDILAAFSPVMSPSENPLDKRSVKYSILSGTSMSCPHAAGVAAYIKSLHPDWSPSAIKSALMTTAWSMNATKNKDAELSYGNGHIDPVKAANPGLVYETSKDDYIKMLCSMYERASLGKILGNTTSCPDGVKFRAKDLNYPSMAIKIQANTETFNVVFPRTVTNVGLGNSTYKATITKNSQLNISVEPSVLSFQSLNEKKSFAVTVSGVLSFKSLNEKKSFVVTVTGDKMVSGSLVWSDGTHSLRSSIVVYTSSFFSRS